VTSPARSAHLRLRGGELRLTWPEGTPAGILVALGPVATPPDLIVLHAESIEEAQAALEWAADHARELGAGDRLHLMGADELAAEARERGWPRLS